MKNQLLILAFFLTPFCNAQSWYAVGPDDFKQISYPDAKNPHVYVDTSGGVYLLYAEILHNYGTIAPYNTHYKYVLKKETATGWQTITNIESTTYAHSFGMNKAGELFFTKDTVVNNLTGLITKKFDGTIWSTVGQHYNLNFTTAPYCKMQFDKNDNPYILISAYGNSVSPEIISWDGSSWVNVGGPIAATTFGKFLFDFNASNEPHVLYYDALNNQVQIKKFDGANWIVVNIPPGGVSSAYQNASKADFRIFNDTMYISYGSDGAKSSINIHSPDFTILKWNGAMWITMVSNINHLLTRAVPAPIYFYFDSVKNEIYLMGGASYFEESSIYKLQGNSISNIGLYGNLAIRNDTSFTVDNPISHSRKIKFVKAFNNDHIENCPLGIPPFKGGGISVNAAIGAHYIYGIRHTFFVDDSSYLNLRLAKYVNNKWESNNGTNHSYQKIYTDTATKPYILYGNNSSGNSLYLYKVKDTIEAIGGNIVNNSFLYGSCAFDTNNVPHVAFIDNTQFGGRRIRVKKFDGTNWQDLSSVNPFASTGVSANPLLFVDTFNQINVLYKEGSNLKISAFDGTNWNALLPNYSSITDSNFQLAVNSTKQPYVSYMASFGGKQKPVVIKFDGAQWSTVGLAGFTTGVAEDVKIYMDKDTPLLVYSDKFYGKVIVAKYNGMQWGALGGTNISRDTSAFPNLVIHNNEYYVSYWSHGIFVKKNTDNILVPFYPCSVPNITINNINDTSATLAWLSSQQVLGYEYYLSASNNPPAGNGIFTNNLTHTASGLQPNTTYYFFVRAFCSMDTSAWNVISFTTTNATDITEALGENTGIRVYPNPFDNVLTVNGLQSGDKIVLLDAMGRVLLRKEAESISENIDAKELAAGYYIIKLYAKEGNMKGNVPVVKR